MYLMSLWRRRAPKSCLTSSELKENIRADVAGSWGFLLLQCPTAAVQRLATVEGTTTEGTPPTDGVN